MNIHENISLIDTSFISDMTLKNYVELFFIFHYLI